MKYLLEGEPITSLDVAAHFAGVEIKDKKIGPIGDVEAKVMDANGQAAEAYANANITNTPWVYIV